jgi:endonuclease YncB( thermonuclease family)
MKASTKKSLVALIVAVLLALFNYYNEHHKEKKTQQSEGKTTEVTPVAADSLRVIAITDGDTFKALNAENQQIKIRMYGIDAPEKTQAFGTKAKQYLSDLIFEKTIAITIDDIDRYGRTVARVYTSDGKEVAVEMLKAGMVWHYKQYSKSEEYAVLEAEAREAERGLWADSDAVPPWEFRKK